MEYNAKCLKCGYVFKTDENLENCICPLCSNEFDTKQTMKNFNNNYIVNKDNSSDKKSHYKIIIEWVIFSSAFCVFIVLLYFIFSFIADFGG